MSRYGVGFQFIAAMFVMTSFVGGAVAQPTSQRLADTMTGSWAIGGADKCATKPFSVSVSGEVISFTDSSGKVDEEQIHSSTSASMTTSTRRSGGVAVGTPWFYQVVDANTLRVTNGSKGTSFTLVRCVSALAGANAPSLPNSSSGSKLWDHNGSSMLVSVTGDQIRIFYQKPLPGIAQAGARPGTQLFAGRLSGSNVSGTATIFAWECGQFTYPVSGSLSSDGRKINMSGKAPVIDKVSCQPRGSVDDVLVFSLVGGSPLVSQNVVTTEAQAQPPQQPPVQPSQAPTAPSQMPSQPQSLQPMADLEKGIPGYIMDRRNTGCAVWTNSPQRGLSVEWDGSCLNGSANGDGITRVFKDGSLLGTGGGPRVSGKLEGHGWSETPTGDRWVGEFRDGKLNGQGTWMAKDGRKYVGEYRDNQQNGQGTWTGADGSTYVGEWHDGKPNGQGTFTSPDGNKYVGEFRGGKFNGHGTWTAKDGSTLVGEFRDGALNGQGTFTSKDGSTYVGEFRDGKFNGQGERTYADGRKEIGEFRDNKFVGEDFEALLKKYSARPKTVTEEVLNYTTTSIEEGTLGVIWISDQNDKCILTEYKQTFSAKDKKIFERVFRYDLRQFNSDGFQISIDKNGQAVVGDERTKIGGITGLPVMERLQKAWGIAFQECPSEVRKRF